MNMTKIMRAIDIVARFINARGEDETYTQYSRRIGLPFTMTIRKLYALKDIDTGLLYQIAKAHGYQIMLYNPKAPDGLEKIYVVGDKECKLKPREKKKKYHISRDTYNNSLFRLKRKYERKKFKKVS